MDDGRYEVYVTYKKKTISGGQFVDEVAAALRYDQLAREIQGTHSKPNFREMTLEEQRTFIGMIRVHDGCVPSKLHHYLYKDTRDKLRAKGKLLDTTLTWCI
jgi:hypothetical protein